MGILSQALERRHTTSYEAWLTALKEPASWMHDWFGGQETSSGVRVDQTTALWSTAYYCGVRILAESVAQLPLVVYERKAGGGRVRVDSHPLSNILHFQPSPEMTSFDWREAGMGHVVTWGNSYSRIDRSKTGEVRELVLLHPAKTKAQRKPDGSLVYLHKHDDGPPTVFRVDEVFHVHGLGFDGVSGYSPVALHANSLGLGMALQDYAARLFSNNARPGGVIQHPGTLLEPAAKRLRESWENMHRGIENSNRVAVLEEGAEYKPMSFNPEEAQSIESRTFQVNEVARILRLPPHMLSELSRATFSNIEHSSLEFVIHSLMPWLVRWEQAILARLFLPAERATLFAEFNVDGLLRGDIESRYKAYAIARTNGLMNGDEIRQKENMNDMPDGLGKHYMIQGAMVSLENAVAPPEPEPEPEPEMVVVPDPEPDPEPEPDANDAQRALLMARGRLGESHIPVFRDAFERLLQREVRGVRRLVKKNPADLDAALGEFYTQHQGAIARSLAPAVRSLAASLSPDSYPEDSFVSSYSEAAGRRHCAGGLRVSMKIPTNRMERIDAWGADDCEDVAREEVQSLIEQLAGTGPEEV